MATYYVKNTGSDAASGLTPALAWQTVDKVSTTTKAPGDVFLFQGGQTHRGLLYTLESGTATNPITFGSYGGGKAILTLATVLSSGWTSIGSNRWTHAVTPVPTQVFFNSVRGTLEVSQAAVNAPLEWFWASDTLTVYSTSDPATAYTNPGIEQDSGGSFGAVAAYGLNYLVCRDLHATKSRYGFWLGGPGTHNTLINCEGSYCYYDGASFLSGNTYGTILNGEWHHNVHNGASFLIDSHFGTVIGGSSHDNAPGSDVLFDGGQGYAFYQVTDCTVSGVDAYDNTYGLKAYDPLTARITFRDNKAHGNSLFGINVDTCGADCVIEYNEVYDNDTHQIAVEVSGTRTIVRYNRVHDGPAGEGLAGIEVITAADVAIYGNVLYLLENGIALYSSPLRTLIYNNTISAWTAAAIQASFDNASISGIVLKNNIADGATGSYLIDAGNYTIAAFVSNQNDWFGGGANKLRYNGATTGLAGWRLATGQDGASIDADPQFVSRATRNYALRIGSPCATSGVNLGSPYTSLLRPSSSWPLQVVLVDQAALGLTRAMGAYAPELVTGGGFPITEPPAGTGSGTAFFWRDYAEPDSPPMSRGRGLCPNCGQEMDRDEDGLFCWDCDE